jgi:hydrogenase maturation protease
MVKSHLEKRGLIIGFGNILRKDDGLGPKAVDLLNEIIFDGRDVNTMTLPQIDITLAKELASVDFAIFVDARIDDSNDSVIIEHLELNELNTQLGHTSHSLSIPSLIGLTRELYENTPDCYMVTPKGYDFSIGESFSPEAEANLHLAVKKIIELIDDFSAICE